MPRGNYWEMVYDPAGASPTQEAYLRNLDGFTGFDKRKIISSLARPEQGNFKKKSFRGCDMTFHMEKGSFTSCTFELCRFVGCDLNVVKFSDCIFEKCHFIHVNFKECIFIDCTFNSNSASSEHFEIVGTEISPDDFLASITTNTSHLPANVTAEYQHHRLTRSKAYLARTLYKSNEIGGNIDYFFQAQKQYIKYGLLSKVEEFRYDGKKKDRNGVPKKDRLFFLKSCLPWLEYYITVVSGWLVDWGRSLIRVSVFTAAVVATFAFLYHRYDHLTFNSSLLRSVEVTSVAGYTIHRDVTQTDRMQWLKVFNLALGLYAYALVVPVMLRRVLR